MSFFVFHNNIKQLFKSNNTREGNHIATPVSWEIGRLYRVEKGDGSFEQIQKQFFYLVIKIKLPEINSKLCNFVAG